MLLEAIAIGLVYGFFFFEWTGLVAGGLVAPGYFAIYFDRPWGLVLCLCTAFVTMCLIRILSSFTLLYGRRRFLLSVLMGFAIQWTLGSMFTSLEFFQGYFDVVGFIIPGLIANEMDRQGIGQTILPLLLLSCLVFLTLQVLTCLRAF